MIKMRKNNDTIVKAEIRRFIRACIDAYKRDDGMPEFYNSNKTKSARKLFKAEIWAREKLGKPCPYYCMSDVVIERSAEKIYHLIKTNKLIRRKIFVELGEKE
jgi:hypothetical protein